MREIGRVRHGEQGVVTKGHQEFRERHRMQESGGDTADTERGHLFKGEFEKRSGRHDMESWHLLAEIA